MNRLKSPPVAGHAWPLHRTLLRCGAEQVLDPHEPFAATAGPAKDRAGSTQKG